MSNKFHFISDFPYLLCMTFGYLLKRAIKKPLESKNKSKCKQIFVCGFSLLTASSIVNSSPVIHSDTIVFQNFSESIVLHKVFEQQYTIEGTKKKVTLANRLIVKTSQAKELLFQYHPQITQVTKLFQGTTFNYFSLMLTSEAFLADVIATLQTSKAIELVQPDILQLQPALERIVDVKSTAALTAVEKKAERIARRKKLAVEQKLLLATGAPYLTEHIKNMWNTTQGDGVKVAIIDDGFDLQHSDLRHVKQLFTYDIENNDTTVKSPNFYQQHGTQVAGVIFAEHNQQGIDGIAPKAGIIAIRQPSSWTSNTLLAFQLAQLAGADIINNSWHTQHLFEPIADVVNDLVVNGRDGLGVAVVFSAGNSGVELSAFGSEALVDKAIVVGATGENGQRLASSNFGDSVDFFTYGDSALSTSNHNKYKEFSGTSLSAAITSGMLALVFSQNEKIPLKQAIDTLFQKNCLKIINTTKISH